MYAMPSGKIFLPPRRAWLHRQDAQRHRNQRSEGMIYFEIQADSPQRATRFYSDVFGWKFVRDANVPIEYWRLDGGEYLGAILQRPAPVPPPYSGTNAFVCSFPVDDFDQIA